MVYLFLRQMIARLHCQGLGWSDHAYALHLTLSSKYNISATINTLIFYLHVLRCSQKAQYKLADTLLLMQYL